MSPKPANLTHDPELEVADTVGQLMEFWGFKRPMGRIWALLYLSPEPLPAAALGDRLQMSAGAVSMALSELSKWGAVEKSWRPGERRDYYRAETGIGQLVQRVLRDRELLLVKRFAATLAAAEREIGGAREHDRPRAEFKKERLRELGALAKLGETLLSALVSGKTVDPAPLLRVARRS